MHVCAAGLTVGYVQLWLKCWQSNATGVRLQDAEQLPETLLCLSTK